MQVYLVLFVLVLFVVVVFHMYIYHKFSDGYFELGKNAKES